MLPRFSLISRPANVSCWLAHAVASDMGKSAQPLSVATGKGVRIRSSGRRASDPDQLSHRVTRTGQRHIDPSSQGREVGILGAEDQAAVGVAGVVQVSEVLAVVRQHRPAQGVSQGEHGVVGDPRPAWPASAAVSTSCPSRLNASTAGGGKFSSAKRRANGYASSCSRSCRSSAHGTGGGHGGSGVDQVGGPQPRPKR